MTGRPALKRYWMVATGLGELPKGKKTGEIQAYSKYDALIQLVRSQVVGGPTTRSQQIRPDQLWLVAFEERP